LPVFVRSRTWHTSQQQVEAGGCGSEIIFQCQDVGKGRRVVLARGMKVDRIGGFQSGAIPAFNSGKGGLPAVGNGACGGKPLFQCCESHAGADKCGDLAVDEALPVGCCGFEIGCVCAFSPCEPAEQVCLPGERTAYGKTVGVIPVAAGGAREAAACGWGKRQAWPPGAATCVQLSFGLTHACCGGAEVLVVGQHFIDQGRKVRIAQALPPMRHGLDGTGGVLVCVLACVLEWGIRFFTQSEPFPEISQIGRAFVVRPDCTGLKDNAKAGGERHMSFHVSCCPCFACHANVSYILYV